MLSPAVNFVVVPVNLAGQSCLLDRYELSLNSDKVETASEEYVGYSPLVLLQDILLLLGVSK